MLGKTLRPDHVTIDCVGSAAASDLLALGPLEKVELTFATSERAEDVRRLLEAGPNLYWSG